MLWCGVVGAALFMVTFVVNGAFKPDYEPLRDTVSESAIGRGGWVQIANFIVCGALIAVSSFGLIGWTRPLIALFGAGLIVSGFFVSDPVPHDHSTPHGTVHLVAGVVVFGSLTAAAFTATRLHPARAWRRHCLLTGIAVPLLFIVSGGVAQLDGLFQRLCIFVGWTWLIAALRIAEQRLPVRLGNAVEDVSARRNDAAV